MSNSEVQQRADAAADTGEIQQVESVAYVGAGDNGLLSALALDAAVPDLDIAIIDDFDEDPPAVGKSMLPAFAEIFHKYLDVDRVRLLSEVPVGFKCSVYYEDWAGDTFHNPAGEQLPIVDSQQFGLDSLPPRAQFDEFYHRYNRDHFTEIYGKIAENPGLVPFIPEYSRQQGTGVGPALKNITYHFNTGAFNDFLQSLCEERGIDLVNDRIEEVETSGTRIERLHGGDGSYDADLYVDATGFRRVLMSELDPSYVEYDIPVDSAIKAEAEIPFDEVQSATVVNTGTAGWFWQIDTYHTRDVGYVYSSDHISDEDARQEFIEAHDDLDLDPDSFEQLQWEAKLLERPWVNNCLAVGNSFGFTEPLQAFSETAAMTLSYWFGTLLAKHGQFNNTGVRERFNEITHSMWEEIYEFQSLFYRYNSGSTPFWEDATSIDSGQIEQCETYRTSGMAPAEELYKLTRTDLDQNRYLLYFLVMQGTGIESEFYEAIDYDVDPTVKRQIRAYDQEIEERLDQLLTYEKFYHLMDLDFD